jgi:twitching motility protein PilT
MLMGKEYGMQQMDSALLQAITDKQIDPEDAYTYALDKRPFERYTTGHATGLTASPASP